MIDYTTFIQFTIMTNHSFIQFNHFIGIILHIQNETMTGTFVAAMK